jgi:hypothetical protein
MMHSLQIGGGAHLEESRCFNCVVCPTLMILTLGMKAHTSVSQAMAIVEFRDSLPRFPNSMLIR